MCDMVALHVSWCQNLFPKSGDRGCLHIPRLSGSQKFYKKFDIIKTEGPIAQDENATREQWSQLSDNAYRFIKNHMAIDNESTVPIPFINLHYAYTQDCIKNGESAKGQNKFKSTLVSHSYRIKNKGPKGEQIAYVMNAKMLSEEYRRMLMEIDDTFDDILITSKENRAQGIMTWTQGIMA